MRFGLPSDPNFGDYEKALREAREGIEAAFTVASEEAMLSEHKKMDWERNEASLFRLQSRQQWNYGNRQRSNMEKKLDKLKDIDQGVRTVGYCMFFFVI